MVPNEAARDERLSWAARGVLTYLLSHAPGWSVTTADVTEAGPAGREAVRTAFRILETFGYIRRVRENDERGRITHWIDLYPYGDAHEASSEGAEVPEEHTPDEPETANQWPGSRAQVSRSPSRRPSTEDSSSTISSSVAPPTQVSTSSHLSRDEPSDSPSVPSSGHATALPLVRRRQLMNAGVTPEQGVVWEQAWSTATSMQWPDGMEMEAENYPDEHLAQHIFQALERGYPLSPSRWVQFFISDRQRQIEFARARLEQQARLTEDPAEREARQNRHLPPDRSREFDPPLQQDGVQP